MNNFFIPSINQLFCFFPPDDSAILSETELMSLPDDLLYKKENYSIIKQEFLNEIFKLGNLIILCDCIDNINKLVLILELLFPKEISSKLVIIHKCNLNSHISLDHLNFICHYDTLFMSEINKQFKTSKNIIYIQLTNYQLNYFNSLYYNDITNTTLDVISKHKSFISLSALNFVQHICIYKDMINNINYNNRLIVLVFQRNLMRKKDFEKIYFYLSDSRVLYKFHIGGDDPLVNSPFHMINSKLGKIDDSIIYKTLLSNIDSNDTYYNLNSCSKLEDFRNKSKMNEVIAQLVNKQKSSIIKHPNISYIDNSTFPIIVKLGGVESKTHHDTYIINSMIELDELKHRFKAEIIMQEYIKSDYIIKGYRICNRNYYFKRQINHKLIDNNYQISNITINKIDKKLNETVNYYSEVTNYPELDNLMNDFEEHTNKNLFGLDFIFNSLDNSYYLIDCNFFPGYKELLNNISCLMNEHVLIYYNKYESNKKLV